MRIAVDNGEFVLLRKTTNGVYHGYVCRWDQLTEPMRNILRDAGLVTFNGKIKK